jgi:hypothetical protein
MSMFNQRKANLDDKQFAIVSEFLREEAHEFSRWLTVTEDMRQLVIDAVYDAKESVAGVACGEYEIYGNTTATYETEGDVRVGFTVRADGAITLSFVWESAGDVPF